MNNAFLFEITDAVLSDGPLILWLGGDNRREFDGVNGGLN